jgi:hypothetical protein
MNLTSLYGVFDSSRLQVLPDGRLEALSLSPNDSGLRDGLTAPISSHTLTGGLYELPGRLSTITPVAVRRKPHAQLA